MPGSTSAGDLPTELITHILQYLNISDRKEAALVCQNWYAASLDPQLQRDVIISVDASVNNARPLTGLQRRKGFHLTLTNLDGSECAEAALLNCQNHLSSRLLTLNLKGSSISEKAFISVIMQCSNLTSLDVSCCNSIFLSGHMLRNHLVQVKLPFLQHLNLSSLHHLTDATLTAFLNMACNLESLHLASTPMVFSSGHIYNSAPSRPSSAALTFQCLLVNVCILATTLTEFNFSRTGITDDALVSMSEISSLKLKRLILISTKELSNNGIISLCQNQTGLVELDLSLNSQLTDPAIKHTVTNSPFLSKFWIKKVRLSDSGVKSLKGLQSIQDLNLRGALLNDYPHNDMDTIFSKLSRLSSLDMGHCAGLSDKSLSCLCQHVINLTTLDLTSCFMLTDVTLCNISKSLTHLEVLSVAWCKRITDYGLVGVVDGHRNIDHDDKCKCSQKSNPYYFNYTPPVKDIAPAFIPPSEKQLTAYEHNAEIFGISSLHALTSLDLSACSNITDVSLLQALCFPALTHLSLDLCSSISDNGLIAVANANPLLERLSFDQCVAVTDKGVFEVLLNCRRLLSLSMSGCSKVTDASIDEIIRRRCQLKTLNIAVCNISVSAIQRLERLVPTLITVNKNYTGCI